MLTFKKRDKTKPTKNDRIREYYRNNEEARLRNLERVRERNLIRDKKSLRDKGFSEEQVEKYLELRRAMRQLSDEVREKTLIEKN